jgi:selenocysteine-specific elongation factor
VAAPLARARAMLHDAALSGVSENQLSEALGDLRQARAIFAALVREGVAIKAGALWFEAAAVADLTARVVDHLRRDERLTIQQFKTMTGLGRKQTIPLLELLDREGVTRRDRDGSDRLRGVRSSSA